MSIQPVQVAKSRRGRFAALLAIAAMVVAIGAWWTSASALPTTTITVTGPSGTLGFGATATYTTNSVLTGGPSTGATTIRTTLPAGVGDVTAIVLTQSGGGSGLSCAAIVLPVAGSTTTATNIDCTGTAITAGTYNIVITAHVLGVLGGAIGAPTAQISDASGAGTNLVVAPATTGFTATPATSVVDTPPPGSTVAPAATVTNATGVPETFVFTLPANVTCQSDPQFVAGTSDTDTTRSCTAPDVTLTGGLTLQSGPTLSNPLLTGTATVTVTVAGNTSGTVCLLLTGPEGLTGQASVPFVSACGTKTYTPAELRHMADPVGGVTSPVIGTTFGGIPINAGCPPAILGCGNLPGTSASVLSSLQDVVNNVRGSRHTVCTVAQNTGVGAGFDQFNVASPAVAAVPVDIPLTLPNTQITVTNGGGYNGPQPVGPQTPNFTDVQVFIGNGANGGLAGATCFSWVSTGAGDQQITVTYVGFDGASHFVNWDVDNNGNNEGPLAAARPNKALIKEWNVLENSTVCLGSSVATCANQTTPNTAVTTTVAIVGVPPVVNNGCTFGVASTVGLTVGSTLTIGLDPTFRVILFITPVLGGGFTITLTGATCLALPPTAGTTITATTGATPPPLQNVNPLTSIAVNGKSLVLDPNTGLWRFTTAATTLTIGDVFNGSHVTSSGSVFSGPLAGVNWTVALQLGSCGNLVLGTGVIATLTGPQSWSGTTTLLVTGAAGNGPTVVFDPGSSIANNCTPSSTATIVFTGTEPTPLGSGTGLTVTEIVTITFTTTVPSKQVFLAWAGQRIMIDHDWRIPAGDNPNGTNVGSCPFPAPSGTNGQRIDYIKGTGPGNFLPGLGAINVTDTTATVYTQNLVSQIADIPDAPQGACISRVLYESEDQGEVDIEAFAVEGGQGALFFSSPVFPAVFQNNPGSVLVASASNLVVGQTFQFGGNPQAYTITNINPGPSAGFTIQFTPGLANPITGLPISPFTCTTIQGVVLNPAGTTIQVSNAEAANAYVGLQILIGTGSTIYTITAISAADTPSVGRTTITFTPGYAGVTNDGVPLTCESFITSTAQTPGDQTKIAFVIYYMKLNTATVSLVTQVSKPAHNSTTFADYTPGNPWDATKDATDNKASWNISSDLLVRGRVTGWFLNSNPSGRARDDHDPLNVLPADRWVMPQDWAILAGGPADKPDDSSATGNAEEFRGFYDLMFAPNNTRGLSLPTPEGTSGGACTGTAIGTVQTPAAGSFISSTIPFGVVTPAPGVPFPANTTTSFAFSTSSQATTGGALICVNGEFRNLALGNSNPPGIQFLVDAAGNTKVPALVLTVQVPLSAVPGAGTVVYLISVVPFEGPYSLIDIRVGGGRNSTTGTLAANNGGNAGAAANNCSPATCNFGAGGGSTDAGGSATRDTVLGDGDVNWWDAPMPPALVDVRIRGTGFIKQVLKSDVYYLPKDAPNTGPGIAGVGQSYPDPYYISNIPGDPFISANVVGGGYFWDSWGQDGPAGLGGIWASRSNGALGQGPYRFWVPMPQFLGGSCPTVAPCIQQGTPSTILTPGADYANNGDVTVSQDQLVELNWIRLAYNDPTISRDLVLYSDNHGEFMVTANGDFKQDLSACAANVLGGGKQCKPGDTAGTGSISATIDYPDFRGKHFPIASNVATVTWTWGGYKDVTVEDGETPAFKYVVFHALDRDGFCWVDPNGQGVVSLHPVLTSAINDRFPTGSALLGNNPSETVDFLIDSGEGIIIDGQLRPVVGTVIGLGSTATFATMQTFSTLQNDPTITGIKEFPNSPLAASGALDECQAWVKVSNSLLGILNVLVIAHDDVASDPKAAEGNIGFDKIIDLQNTATFTLNFRWTLITWTGADNIPVSDAIGGTGANDPGNDISDQVTAVYGWDAAAQNWLGYFPSGVSVPGANNLTALKQGSAYWIAIKGPSSVTWTIATNVGR